jgi:exoribonuclease II
MMKGWLQRMMGKKRQKQKRTRVVMSDPNVKETAAQKQRRRKVIKDMQNAADKKIVDNLKKKRGK